MNARAAIVVDGITCRYDAAPVLNGVSLQVAAGEFLGIVGPNGSGKTTLLRTLNALLAPDRGTVLLDGLDLASLDAREIARRMAVVPQRSGRGFGFTVGEVVLMGRTPHLAALARESAQDLAIAGDAMERTGIAHLADRRVDALSGGEVQRVLLARALAQAPRVLLLDEPTAHLDVRYQLEIMDLLAAMQSRLTIVAALHDLNLAARYADRVVLLDQGRITALGDPSDVLTPPRLEAVYGAAVFVQPHPTTNRPHVIILGRRSRDAGDTPGGRSAPVVSERPRHRPIVAIDGPVGAGKSTVAMTVAERLGFRYVDTGAMYRSVAWLAQERGIDLADETAVADLAREAAIEFVPGDDRQRILVNGIDATEQIRHPDVSTGASVVSTYPAVREALVAQQRRLGAGGDLVMEGRDIGTVVFPDAEVKVFLDASPEERARRRHAEMQAKGTSVEFEALRRAEEERDRRDRTRPHSPLRRADDAVVIDTTGRSVEAVAEEIVALVKARR